MNLDKISKRVAAKAINTLAMDPLTQKVAEFFRDNPAPSDSDFHMWTDEQKLDTHVAEAAAYRLATMAVDFLFYGRAAEKGISDADVDEQELGMGMSVEMEHTQNPLVAKRIALDHLAELPDYYTRLKAMEEEAGIKD